VKTQTKKKHINRAMLIRHETKKKYKQSNGNKTKKQRRKQFLEAGLISQRMIGSREN